MSSKEENGIKRPMLKEEFVIVEFWGELLAEVFHFYRGRSNIGGLLFWPTYFAHSSDYPEAFAAVFFCETIFVRSMPRHIYGTALIFTSSWFSQVSNGGIILFDVDASVNISLFYRVFTIDDIFKWLALVKLTWEAIISGNWTIWRILWKFEKK